MTAVAWSAIGLLAATLAILATSQISAIHALGGKIDAMGARLDARIDALGARLDSRIDGLASRVDANTTELMRLSRRLEEHLGRHAG